MKTFKLALFALMFLWSVRSAYAGSEEWYRKAAQAATSLAKGDVNSAVYNAAPNANFQVRDQTNVHLNASGVGISQPIIPHRQLGNTPFNISGNYNAHAPASTRPDLGQNVNVGVGGKYFNTNTTFSPDN